MTITRRTFSLPDLLCAVLVLLFVALSWNASRQESVTIDEFRHLSTGVYYWQSGDYAFDAATPPLWKMAMALPAYLAGAKMPEFRQVPEKLVGWQPWFVATDFMRDNAAAYTGYLQSARLVNILAAAGCLLLLYCRGRRLFGTAAALFGTAFLALSPTFLAHSHYATTDIIATLTMTAIIFLLIDYRRMPGLARLAGLALAFSLAILCKFSALLLVPLLVIVPCAAALNGMKDAGLRNMLPALAPVLTVVLVVPLLTVNLFYGFRGTGAALQQMELGSRSLSALAQSAAGSVPLPLPQGFVEGFDKQKTDSDYAECPGFLRGQWSADGFRHYFLAAFGLKETLPFLLLLAVAVVLALFRTGNRLFCDELPLLVYVPITLFIVLSFMNKLNVGIRYLLPAYPFFCLCIAWLYRKIVDRRGALLVLLLVLVLHSISVLRASPHFTAYFNWLAGGPANGYRHLVDSNVDWGQDLIHLQRYMRAHGIDKIQLAYFGHGLPEMYGIDYELLTGAPRPGYAAISVSLVQGQPYLLTYTEPPFLADFGHYTFMQRLTPVGRAGYSILVYRID